MAQPFLAYIVPVDPNLRPEHPIVIPPVVNPEPPQPPLGIWGGANEGFPTHPIYIPKPPLVIWGPNDPRPAHPIVIPLPPVDGGGGPTPEHPIELPPGTYCIQVPITVGENNVYWKWVCFTPDAPPCED